MDKKVNGGISFIKKIVRNNISESFLWEVLYLIIFAIFQIYYFTRSIQYPSEWPNLNYNYIHIFLFIYVFFKYAVMKNFTLKNIESILSILLLFSFTLSSCCTGYVEIFDTALFILGAKDVNDKHIVKTYLIVKIPLILMTIFGSQIGIIENLVYNQNGRIREAFGFVYPTDFAAQIFFAFAAWIFLRRLQISIWELILMSVIALFLKIKCDTRCSVLCILLIVLGTILIKVLDSKKFKCGKRSSLIFSKLQKVWGVIPWALAAFMILISRFYSPDNQMMLFLNNITSQRLKFGKKIFDYYDVKLYGQYIEMQGNGGTTEKPIDYTFIDCSYLNILMRFGLFVFVVVLILISFLMIKKYENIFVIMLLLTICLHSMMEHHLLEVYYNFTIVLPFSRGFLENNHVSIW